MSFKLKLALYFLVLALVPLAAAFVGFSGVVDESETRLVDARLHAGLRATAAAYDEELLRAARAAERLARDPGFQRALARKNEAAIAKLLEGRPNVRVSGPAVSVGPPSPPGETREAAVIGPGGRLGLVIAAVPLDRALVRRLRARSGLERYEHVLVLLGNRIVASSAPFGGRLTAPAGTTATVTLGGAQYRALAARADERPRIGLVVASPQSRIDDAKGLATRQLLAMLAITLLLVVTVAYLEGRSIVRTVSQLVDASRAVAGGRLRERVPVRGRDELALLARTFNEMAEQLESRASDLDAQRRRLREATVRFGEALASTHDTRALLQSVAATIVEATDAAGAVVRGGDGAVIRVGQADDEDGLERIVLPLGVGGVEFGRLDLLKQHFEDEDREAAVLLAGQAVVALENARLHRIVEREALVDQLTGLANRRQAERVLDAEITRATRFGTALAVAVVDLDDFKAVNDLHGHQVGDAVLRDLAGVLRNGLRQFDVAARWGGEEFLLVLPGTDAEGAAHVADRLRAAVAARTVPTTDGADLHVTASFGVAAVAGSGDRDALIRAADAALYEAKRAGKDRVVVAGASAALR